jgi:hypothetical protein
MNLHGRTCATLVGGGPVLADIAALRKWPTAVVGTPGRLLDHIKHERLDLSEIIYCAVDEIDTSTKNTSFRPFFDALNDALPECRIVAVSSRMTLDVVAPVKALLKPNSPIPMITRMGRHPRISSALRRLGSASLLRNSMLSLAGCMSSLPLSSTAARDLSSSLRPAKASKSSTRSMCSTSRLGVLRTLILSFATLTVDVVRPSASQPWRTSARRSSVCC